MINRLNETKGPQWIGLNSPLKKKNISIIIHKFLYKKITRKIKILVTKLHVIKKYPFILLGVIEIYSSIKIHIRSFRSYYYYY